MFCMKPQGGFAFSASKHSTNSHVFPPLYSECCFIESLTIRKSSLFVVIPCRYNFRASLSSCVVSLSSCVFLCLFFTVLFNFRSMLCCRFWRIKINISADTALLISAVSWSLVCCCSCELCFYGKTNGNVLATFSNRASAHIRRLLWNPDIFLCSRCIIVRASVCVCVKWADARPVRLAVPLSTAVNQLASHRDVGTASKATADVCGLTPLSHLSILVNYTRSRHKLTRRISSSFYMQFNIWPSLTISSANWYNSNN